LLGVLAFATLRVVEVDARKRSRGSDAAGGDPWSGNRLFQCQILLVRGVIAFAV